MGIIIPDNGNNEDHIWGFNCLFYCFYIHLDVVIIMLLDNKAL